MKYPPQAIAYYFSDAHKKQFAAIAESELLFLFKENLKRSSQVVTGVPIYSNDLSLTGDLIQKITSASKEFGYSSFQLAESESELDFFRKIASKLPPSKTGDTDWDEVSIVVFDGIFPLLDISCTKSILERHDKFLSQYSYSENLPPGIVPRILTREFIVSLPSQYAGTTHDFLSKNINHYDTEIFYQAPDLRQWRLDFSLSSHRSFRLSQDLLKEKDSLVYSDILPLLLSKPSLFRSAPSYLEIEVFKGCEYECIFCPRQFADRKNDGTSLKPETLSRLLDQMDSAFRSEFSICFGGLGEPLLHPNLDKLIKITLDSPFLKEFYLETALYGNIDTLTKAFAGRSESDFRKTNIIVNLTTRNPKTYARLYGKDNLSEILTNLEKLSSVLPKSSIHLQFIKMKEIEEELDQWYEIAQKEGYGIILQKHNSYAGRMQDKRAADLTPVVREFCWHLARDIYMTSEGEISVCKQLPGGKDKKEILGNINAESLASVWAKGQNSFSNSANGKHEAIPAPCLSCDEWYTFNA
ncbi:spiro-SPASM protein [Leptospira perolatii]|uniref:Spiro-SPASM protein n=1 Tax=Leptospira perolatii TaxID=2023191 RepID=A0A2M9ZM49_9LEPT|nr:spiro-SPASM protein [Leptospira perolatii]PJZ69171.1 spiro-SPASM protein [Leptospira perolatii]PJZ73085.1 spiro-SPASM protein [Leptospira perolatii]